MKIKKYAKLSILSALLGMLCAVNKANANSPASELAPMPEPVTSFGAVTAGDWLYVHGGHKGERHDYNTEMVSGSMRRLKLSEGKKWENLPGTVPAQGLPLVAHGHYLYRIGGMAARNHQGEKQDLFSMTTVQRFDVRSRQWEPFTALPAPRSSHDAVVVGDTIYVAGGWSMSGGTNKPVWLDRALMLDLKKSGAQWQEFPQPFRRRALALAAVGTRIFCIGGMDSDNQPTRAVEIYDTASGKWSSGPALPPGKHEGFSCSAIAQQGRIYASAFKGDLLRLASDAGSWEIVGRLKHPRLSHRLVTAGAGQVIALGGEDGEDKRPELELLTPLEKGRAAESVSTAAATTSGDQ